MPSKNEVYLIGSFNWIGGLPQSFNRIFALDNNKSGINIIFNTSLIVLLYSVLISIAIYFILHYSNLEVWPLYSVFISVFLYNIWVIGRNALEVKGYFVISAFLKFIFQLLVLTIPLIFASFSFIYLSLYLFLINCFIYFLIASGVNKSISIDLKLSKDIIAEGIRVFSYSGLNQSYLMIVPLLVKSMAGISMFSLFVPIFELTSKSGIIGNAVNTVIAPSVSNGTIKSDVLRNRNNELFLFVVIVGIIVGTLSADIVQTYYLKVTIDDGLQMVYQSLLVSFLVMSLVALNIRIIVASGKVGSVLRFTTMTYFFALIFMVFAPSIQILCFIFMVRSIIEFIYIQWFVRSTS